jgi:hypothetical protein
LAHISQTLKLIFCQLIEEEKLKLFASIGQSQEWWTFIEEESGGSHLLQHK